MARIFLAAMRLEAVGRAEGDVLDAVAVVGVGFAGERELDGIEGIPDGLVADGVDGELESLWIGRRRLWI